MKILDIEQLCQIIKTTGIKPFYLQLIDMLEQDFSQWESFYKSPRHAIHFEHGVIELMPCANDEFYTFKYVNAHPSNTMDNKLCVVAVGMLSDVASGYPLMISEMTLLTALRTAATAALGAKYLARKESSHISIIGTGAQAEFQIQAVRSIFPITHVSYYDIDERAMRKFAHNLADEDVELIPCQSIQTAIQEADIIITATAAKKRVELFSHLDIKPGTHIHAMGGDCPGKTEFSSDILANTKVVVEFIEQSQHEGEIQQGDVNLIDAELWEIITGHKKGREDDQEITFFDSVGFALEDFSILKLVYQLAESMNKGETVHLIPHLEDAKDLYRLIR